MSASGADAPAESGDIHREEGDTEDGAHRRLHDFGIIQVHGVFRGHHAVNAEPVPDPVQGQIQPFFRLIQDRRGNPDRRQDRRRGGKGRKPGHRLFADFIPPVHGHDFITGRQGLRDHLFPFDHEKAAFLPSLFPGEGGDEFHFIPGDLHDAKL